MRIRRAGIIAAGLGSRLAHIHPGLPKPMIPVSGKPLLYWIAACLRNAGFESVTILLNSNGDDARAYAQKHIKDLSWSFLRADTDSSFDSFRLVAEALAQSPEPFCISTVDALIPPAETARFAENALRAFDNQKKPDAALALTRFVEDEKPLWADTDDNGQISALGERARRKDAVTCGLYALSRETALELPPQGTFARLRDFWSDIISRGKRVRGVLLADTVDVDRPEDIPAAEKVISCFDV